MENNSFFFRSGCPVLGLTLSEDSALLCNSQDERKTIIKFLLSIHYCWDLYLFESRENQRTILYVEESLERKMQRHKIVIKIVFDCYVISFLCSLMFLLLFFGNHYGGKICIGQGR